MGRGYVIDHCISTLKREKLKETEEKSFRIYVTDALSAIAENTTHFQGATEMFDYGRSLNMRWNDIITNAKEKQKKDQESEQEKEDTRTATEFATDLWKRIRKRK